MEIDAAPGAGAVETTGLPELTELWRYEAAFGCADDERADLTGATVDPHDAPRDFVAVLDAERRAAFGEGEAGSCDLGAVRTAVVLVVAADWPDPDLAEPVLAGVFSLDDDAAGVEGTPHQHGP